MATKRTRKTLRRAAIGIAIVVVVAVGLLGYKAAAGSSTSANHYRTVTAAAGTVTQTIALSGIVHHVTQDSVSFPTSGMVTAVHVKAGDTVTAGQVLASIDTQPLQNAVLAANATYTAAVAQYETDQQTYASASSASATKAATTGTSAARQSTAGTGSSQAASGSPSGSAGPGGTGGGGGAGDSAAAVKAATDALAALETGVKRLGSALPVFVSECIPLIPTTTAAPQATVTKTVTATATVTHTVTVAAAAASSGATSATSAASSASSASSSAASTAASSASATSKASSAVTAACQAAITTLTSVQSTLPDQMTAANVTLAAAVKALNAQAAALQQESAALQKQQASQAAAAAAQAAAAKQQASSLSSSNSALQAAAAAGLSRGGGNSTVTAATLITDEAAIQSDSIALAQAKDQLAQASLTSPIAGKVASMPFVVGQQASATATAVIIGTGAIEVTVAAPLASRPLLATGEATKVTSVVGGTTLQGTISRISLLPTTTGFSLAAGAGAAGGAGGNAASSNTSTTTYATVITVPTGGDGLPEGSRVQTTITTKSVDAPVVVPASAVTPLSSGSGTVQVITNGIVSTKRVVTGVVGSTEIQIVSGVTAGETVVIADVTKPIAGASIAASRGAQNSQQFPNGGGNFTPGGNAGGNAGSGGNAGQGGVEPPTGGAQPS
jgi:multidrug efflux pump subunit AcrA (membrane-fusion protein)